MSRVLLVNVLDMSAVNTFCTLSMFLSEREHESHFIPNQVSCCVGVSWNLELFRMNPLSSTTEMVLYVLYESEVEHLYQLVLTVGRGFTKGD